MKEYDIFIPLTYNDGSPVESEKIERIGKELLAHFDGLTYFPQENEGFWKMGGIVYRDKVVVFRAISQQARRARQFLKRFKEELKRLLRQEEILIVERDVRTL